MYIVKRKIDDVVFAYSENKPVFSSGVLSEPLIALDVKESDYIIEEVMAPEFKFYSNIFRYDNGWFISDEEMYAELQEITNPEPVPLILSARQARLVLHSIGRLSDVAIAIAALPENDREYAEIEWEYATEIHREHRFTGMLADMLRLTGNQVDQLFIDGVKL
ncbi:hypothetical protein [Oceanospirillum sediminis]|uniref:Uncharacterized protein n=1 Tax=Oceanospirillum sediminis TaxID=2760088 RepID=A0A839INN0_9GAMM|nr:hypothetical protein [Oceanospirillum sediminis]MBB1485886.1 hypothetical protein [Oceanospirillum sediminis]